MKRYFDCDVVYGGVENYLWSFEVGYCECNRLKIVILEVVSGVIDRIRVMGLSRFYSFFVFEVVWMGMLFKVVYVVLKRIKK